MRDSRSNGPTESSSRRAGATAREPARFNANQNRKPGIVCPLLGFWRRWLERLDPARQGERAACELAEIVARSNDADELRRAVVRLACRIARADRAELFREIEAGFSPRRVAVWPEAARPLVPGVEDATTVSLVDEDGPLPEGSRGEVFLNAAILQENVEELRLPILVAGRAWGELRLFASRGRSKRRRKPWPAGLIRPLESLCALVAGVEISMTSALDPVSLDPTRDPLTGRPNAAFLNNVLPLLIAYARRRGEPLTLLCIAAERLDVVREVQGPSIADALLRRLSHAVSATLRTSDLVARLDIPDTFIAVLLGAPIADAAGVVVEAVRRAVVEAGIASAYPLTVSIGISGFPDHGQDADRLIASALAAVEIAQASGPNQAAIAARPNDFAGVSRNSPPNSPRGRRSPFPSQANPNSHASAAVTLIAHHNSTSPRSQSPRSA